MSRRLNQTPELRRNEIRCRWNPPSYNAPMFARTIKFLALSFLAVALSGEALAAEARIKKVLPHLIDWEGRNSISPSLYERDAYQAFLRQNPDKRSGISFDVQWNASRARNLILRVEMRGVRENAIRTETLELPVKKKGFFSNWSSVVLRDWDYKDFGDLAAWRATLWDGDKQVAEQKSFLW